MRSFEIFNSRLTGFIAANVPQGAIACQFSFLLLQRSDLWHNRAQQWASRRSNSS
jgi:hypothetical protein